MYWARDGIAHWHSVTAELHSAKLPLSQWFRAVLPHRSGVFEAFRSTVNMSCIEPPLNVPAGTAGAAFDFLVRCMLGEPPSSNSVVESIYDYCPSRLWADVASEIVSSADSLAEGYSALGGPGSCEEELLRVCWSIALFVELVRGVKFDRSALGSLTDGPTYRRVLELMPRSAIGDLRSLLASFWNSLRPLVDARLGEIVVGPAFSWVLPGDADFIKGGTIFEIKAMVHRRKRDGTPRYGLDSRTIYQVLAYALLAQQRFSVDEVVIFNARYSHVYSWNLDDLLTELAGKQTNAAHLAAELEAFLGNPLDPGVPLAAREAADLAIGRGVSGIGRSK